MTTVETTDAQRARTAVDLIADLLDLPLVGEEPIGELADRCVPALRQLGVDLECAEVALASRPTVRQVQTLRAERDEAVAAVQDLVDNYAAHDQEAFEAAHARACAVLAAKEARHV